MNAVSNQTGCPEASSDEQSPVARETKESGGRGATMAGLIDDENV